MSISFSCRETIIAEARSLIGAPYHHQAALEGVWCDCLGLVRGVWRAVYGADPEHPPAYSRDWAETLREETLADDPGRHMIPLELDARTRRSPALRDQRQRARQALRDPRRRRPNDPRIESHPVAEVSLVPWWRNRLRFVFRFPEV